MMLGAWLLRHDVGCMAGCVTASSAWWRDQRSPPLKRMLRHGVGCLAEGLFERLPPLRAFGPPVGMTMVGPCSAGYGGCHRGHRGRRGHKGNPGNPPGLCGLCDSLWLVLPLRAVHPVRGRVACGVASHALRPCVGWQPLNPKGELDGACPHSCRDPSPSLRSVAATPRISGHAHGLSRPVGTCVGMAYAGLHRRSHSRTENRKTVVDSKGLPGRRTVEGKFGWLGESGKCCVSTQKAPC